MKCPKCGTIGAYIGLLSIECINEDCEHFSVDQCAFIDAEIANLKVDAEQECSSPEKCCHDCAKCSEKDDNVPF